MPRAKREAASGRRITAVICLDRADDAATKAVDSLVQQSLPKEDYEILLIGTPQPEQLFGGTTGPWDAVPNLRRVEDGAADATDARNLALQLSQAPLVAFLDAHAVAEPGWLASYCRTFEQFGEIARAVGGRVRPLWEVSRPDWLGDELLADLSIVDLGDEARFLAAGERLAAVNIAFSKAAANALGGFRPAADGTPAPDAVALGEAPEPIDQIGAPAGRAIYDPLAAVDYLIPADRLSQEWFRSRAAWRAVSDLKQFPPPTPAAVAERWQAVKDFFFECPPTERTIRGLALRQDDPRRFRAQIAAIYDSLFCLLSGIGESDYD
jgi:glucosyl-dolichyl phosphate glucuronosyltransferase